MNEEIIGRLFQINRHFYREFAPIFALSRSHPWASFALIADRLPQPCPRFLDVGCGDGRLGRYLQKHALIEQYVGVDFSTELLDSAEKRTIGDFHERNLLEPDCLDGLGQFDCVVCLATMHHIPTRAKRLQLLHTLASCLNERGRLILANFQFLDSERQQRKVVDWSAVGIDPQEVEAGDYLLSWKLEGEGVRYIALIDEAETAAMVAQSDLVIVEQFRCDGKEGNLNLYTVLEKRK